MHTVRYLQNLQDLDVFIYQAPALQQPVLDCLILG